MKESERLIAAKALIDTPRKWMQGDYHDLPGDIKNSTCFCSLGAIRRTYVDNGESFYGDTNESVLLLETALLTDDPVFDEGDVASFNDTHSHEDVLYLFDKAIQIAQAEGN